MSLFVGSFCFVFDSGLLFPSLNLHHITNLRRDGPDNDIGSPTALLSLRELNDLRRTHCCLTSFRVDSRAETFALSAAARRARAVGVFHSLFMAVTSKEIRKCAIDGLGPSVMIRRTNTSLSLCWLRRSRELGGLRASETEAATGRGNKPLYS